MRSARRRRTPRGTILVVGILLLTLLATLGTGLLSSSMTENTVTVNDVNAQRAFAVAEGGIAHARRVIAANIHTTSLTSRLSGATSTAPEVALSGLSNYSGLGTGNGTYSAWISNNLTAYNKSPGYAADAAAASDADNRVWIRSVGTYRNATRTVRALVDFSSVLNPPGTITLIDGTGADTATVNGNAFLVTGNDTAAPTATGACGSVEGSLYGISVNSSASLTALGNAVADNQEDNITGTGGTAAQGSYANNGSISAGTLQSVANALTPGATAIPGGSNSSDYGTAALPGIFVATSDIKLLGNGKGYGVLIVTAGFEMAGNYKWEGVILVIGGGTASITGADSKLYGSLFLANTQGGATHVTLSGNGGAYFSSQALCRVENLLPSSTIIGWEQIG
ncbi:MAG: hypothetical protein HYY88_10830 [candidate division NC10 bacterium]|nr:hypothetical protein [candidate division NC10 bacterium]